jgi:hypothetical protein
MRNLVLNGGKGGNGKEQDLWKSELLGHATYLSLRFYQPIYVPQDIQDASVTCGSYTIQSLMGYLM